MRAASIAALVLFSAGCGAGSAGTRPQASSCRSDHLPFPPPALALTSADSGRTATVRPGELVAVTLRGRDAPGGRWPELAITGGSLVALPDPAEAATVGTRLAELCAVREGTTVLSSDGWTVHVDVS